MLCDELGGGMRRWEGGSGGRGRVYLQLIHVVGQQKLRQHCKPIILQLKINLKRIKHVLYLSSFISGLSYNNLTCTLTTNIKL